MLSFQRFFLFCSLVHLNIFRHDFFTVILLHRKLQFVTNKRMCKWNVLWFYRLDWCILSWPMINCCRSVFVTFGPFNCFSYFKCKHWLFFSNYTVFNYMRSVRSVHSVQRDSNSFFFDFHHSINQAFVKSRKKHALASCHPYRTAVRLIVHSNNEKNYSNYAHRQNGQSTRGDAIYIPMKIYFYSSHTNEKPSVNGQGARLWRTFISILNHLIQLGRFAGCNHVCVQFRFHWTVQDIINLPRSNAMLKWTRSHAEWLRAFSTSSTFVVRFQGCHSHLKAYSHFLSVSFEFRALSRAHVLYVFG